MEQFELYLFCYEGVGMKQKPKGCNRDCQTLFNLLPERGTGQGQEMGGIWCDGSKAEKTDR